MAAELDTILDRIDRLRGRAREVTALSGGLTNHNYKVVTDDGVYVVRCSPSGTELLAIDRDREYRNSQAAARAGVGAPVIDYLAGAGVLVVGFLDGPTFTDAHVRANLDRVAQACRQLHAGPRFVGDFDMFAIQRRYRALVAERGFRIPLDYDDFAPAAAQLHTALTARPQPTVPCNNDLLAANFIDGGDRVWIIDYEYAGNNDPDFELGNLASECRLDRDDLAQLVAAYYHRESPAHVARARLFGLMAHYGWTLWASIQASTSAIEFDFWSWGMDKYDQARAQFADPDFARLLDQAAADE